MNKMLKFAAVFCVAAAAAAGGLTSFAKEAGQAAQAETAGLVMFEGTVVSVEDGRLTMNQTFGDGTQTLVVTLADDTKILEAANGYPIPGENLEAGEAVCVYAGAAMTMSLPPIVNGVLVLADVPADAGFPVYTTVSSVTQDSAGNMALAVSDGNTYTVNSSTVLLPYLTRNIVTTADLTAGTPILLWTDGETGSTAVKIVVFQNEGGRMFTEPRVFTPDENGVLY